MIDRGGFDRIDANLQKEVYLTQDIDISNNTRNGYYPKTIKGSHGEVEIFVPRDRSSSFEPIIIEKEAYLTERLSEVEVVDINLNLRMRVIFQFG